jgi:hypothetical protein
MATRRFRWFRPAVLFAAALPLLLAIALAHPLPLRFRIVAEASVYLLLALAVASSPPLRRAAMGLGAPRLAVLGVAFVVATVVQLVKVYGPAYPFVPWSMYGSVAPPAQFPSFEADLGSGLSVPFPFSQVTPSSSPRSFLTGFARQLHGVRVAEDDATRLERSAEIERMLSSLARRYNARNPADPIVGVRAGICSIPLDDFRGPESFDCDEILAFAVAAEGVVRR